MLVRSAQPQKKHGTAIVFFSLVMVTAIPLLLFNLGSSKVVDSSVEGLLSLDTSATSSTLYNRSSKPASLLLAKSSPEVLWEQLLDMAAPSVRESSVVFEVGVHSLKQTLQAAKRGWDIHAVEPSPPSLKRMENRLQKEPADVQGRIHIHQVAAGSTSGGSLEFRASGSTGDHAAGVDAWNMKVIDDENPAGKDKIITVPVQRLDDLIVEQEVYVLKVDTQGFEPTVFSGLDGVLEGSSKTRISYILTEYHPKLMDLMASKIQGRDLINDESLRCQQSTHLLQSLADHGYQLYAMGVAAHPKAGNGWKKLIGTRPSGDVYKNCLWYYELETKAAIPDFYKFGFWSDILAVAPGMPLPAGFQIQQ